MVQPQAEITRSPLSTFVIHHLSICAPSNGCKTQRWQCSRGQLVQKSQALYDNMSEALSCRDYAVALHITSWMVSYVVAVLVL